MTTKLDQFQRAIHADLERLGRYMEIERLERVLRAPLLQIDQPVVGLIPSFVLAGDGIALRGLAAVTERYLCDIRLSDREFDYDVVDRDTIFNYRFQSWTHEVRQEEVVKATYQIANVELVHLVANFRTLFEFVGDTVEERDRWISHIVKLIPIASVSAHRR